MGPFFDLGQKHIIRYLFDGGQNPPLPPVTRGGQKQYSPCLCEGVAGQRPGFRYSGFTFLRFANASDRSSCLLRCPWSLWFSAKFVVVPQQTHQQLCQCTESAVSRCSRVGHLPDGSVSVTLVWTRIYHVIHVKKDRIVFRYKEETRICIVLVEQRRLVQASGVLEQLCLSSKSPFLTSDSWLVL